MDEFITVPEYFIVIKYRTLIQLHALNELEIPEYFIAIKYRTEVPLLGS